MSLELHAHAKINLHLDIGPRRQDGYHSLKTLFQEISLHDRLVFSPTDGAVQLTADSHGPPGDENIVIKALALLKQKMKTRKGMMVSLEKKIPMGAGLGGGSSDAAAALKAGWLLWKKTASPRKRKLLRLPPILLQCAEKLGADVAFFLRGGTAWAKGKGEKLRVLGSQEKRWIVLIYPKIHVATKEAYRLLDESRKKKDAPPVRQQYFNSFEPVIFKKYPEIASVHQSLSDLGCIDVMMSGSGSSVYGFVRNPAEGSRVISQLQHKAWDIFLTHTI